MAFTFKVVSAKKDTSLADNDRFLDVAFQVINEEGVVEAERKLAFPLTASKDEIEAELQRYASVFAQDKELAAASKKVEEAESNADAVAEALLGGKE